MVYDNLEKIRFASGMAFGYGFAVAFHLHNFLLMGLGVAIGTVLNIFYSTKKSERREDVDTV